MLHAQICTGARHDLHVLCLHLDLLESGRQQQLARLVHRIQRAVPRDAPLLIAGDFNDWNHRTGRALERDLGLIEIHKSVHGRLARSFPSWLPLLPLDRMYCRHLEPVSAHRCSRINMWCDLSDHAAYLAELRADGHSLPAPRRRG